MDLLSIPSNTGSLRLVQWPLFLLSSKVQSRFRIQLSMVNFLIRKVHSKASLSFDFCRYSWLLIWLWIAKIRRKIYGTEYVGMSIWHMQFKNATTVLKKSYMPLSMVKGDFGIIILLLLSFGI